MTTLTREARETIKWHACSGDGRQGPLTIAGYVRHTFPDGVWGGDECGCTDDRCIGYHHDATDECQCLPVLLDQYYLEAFAPSWWTVVISGDGTVEWVGQLGDTEREIGQWLDHGSAESARANWERLGYRAQTQQRERTAA